MKVSIQFVRLSNGELQFKRPDGQLLIRKSHRIVTTTQLQNFQQLR